MIRRLVVETVASLAVAAVLWAAGWLIAEPDQWQPFEEETADE